nr:contractile injection system protein, VgrG/Pvc8 family [Yersinia alsatica]
MNTGQWLIANIRVTRSIERLPSDFSLSLMDLYPGSDNQQWVNPGDPCVVSLGDDVVRTGYIDRWAPMISRSRREVRATGRSKCQDLVDCSAEWPNNVISQSTVLQIAQRLAQPYSITVSSDVTNLDIVPYFTLNWGESSQEIIDRITRWAALLYYDLPDGSLYLTRVGTRKASSSVAQGINIEDAAYNSGMDQRFSDYIGVSMSVIRGELLSIYRQLERAAIVENFELFSQYLTVERNADNPNRLDVSAVPLRIRVHTQQPQLLVEVEGKVQADLLVKLGQRVVALLVAASPLVQDLVMVRAEVALAAHMYLL